MKLENEFAIHQEFLELLALNNIDLSNITFEFGFYKYNWKIIRLYKDKKYIKEVEYLWNSIHQELKSIFKIVWFTPEFYRKKNINTLLQDFKNHFKWNCKVWNEIQVFT